MLLPIVHYNNPILRQRGVKVAEFDAPLRKLVDDMIETMHAAEGIGLAAQQIGRAIQLCVVDLRATDKDFDWLLDGAKPPADILMPFAVINPKITPKPGTRKMVYEEGCLSFAEIRGDVVRPDEVLVQYQDAYGVSHELLCNGLLSRCIQHETDHLNGTLFIDRMEKAVRAKVEPAVKELARKTKTASEAA
ncbi:peptide deformylase [mine drainage metagenome]|uniref:Peptide deformylase n=1 Tax=mine drainage metagenome TaxID=410659 RepID=A0A1J5S9S1_9ZZZZ